MSIYSGLFILFIGFCTATGAPKTVQEAHENAIKVSKLYNPRQVDGEGDLVNTAPPQWATDFIISEAFPYHAKLTEIYFDASDSIEEVQQAARHREPVNIEMERFYKEAEFEQVTGYRHGAYNKSTAEKLMPNIAIYTYTPIKLNQEDANIHVINLIGNGFDTPKQPDFQYFLDGKNRKPSPEKLVELKARIEMMYRYAFECAKRKDLTKIQWGGVGDGNFAACSEEGVDLKPEIRELNNAAKEKLKEEYPGIEVLEGWNDKPFFNVPTAFFEDPKPNLETTLYINAWDPWSLVGNGHEGDNSLDGKYGRISAMAWLSWYMTNPFLNDENYVAVKEQAQEALSEATASGCCARMKRKA